MKKLLFSLIVLANIASLQAAARHGNAEEITTIDAQIQQLTAQRNQLQAEFHDQTAPVPDPTLNNRILAIQVQIRRLEAQRDQLRDQEELEDI